MTVMNDTVMFVCSTENNLLGWDDNNICCVLHENVY